jgi:3'-phosphoadenosine 5'-phosphosulfate sulfotransferase (PAPS reductase)/FAD synthetase
MVDRPAMPDGNKPIAVVSMSGGKDSTATALIAIEAYGRDRVICVCADTGNERAEHMDYVTKYLPDALGVPVHIVRADFSRQMAGKREWIKKHWAIDGVPESRIERALAILQPTGNPFLDLCLWKGRFPSRKAQFCTQDLKGASLSAFMDALPYRYDDQGREVIHESWRGVRRDESEARKDALYEDLGATKSGRVFRIFQPIIEWDAQTTVNAVLAAGVKLSPLYSQGMSRVGCAPCINCGKDELLEIARRWPEEIDRIAEWERLVSEASKLGASTFFHDSAADDETDQEVFDRVNIRQRVEWSKTSRGGKQYDLVRAIPGEGCSSHYGLCE